ncbi:MAG: NAD-dependent epimerase/dehydratase family protein [Oscillospiraceae bacterium]
MKFVLVTGACGVIGEKVCSGLIKKNNMVIAVDTKPSEYNEFKINYQFIQAGPLDKEIYSYIFREYDIDTVVHLACSVDNDFNNIISPDKVKTAGVCDSFLYKMAVAAGVKQFLLLSTHQVYEIPKSREPIREDDEIKCITNYAKLKYHSEQTFRFDVQGYKQMVCAIIRTAPIYTLDYYENLTSKIIDPKNNTAFIYREGDYAFHFCCLHNLVDFILGYIKQADTSQYSGLYNVADQFLTSANEIIEYMRTNHKLGPVLQRKEKPEALQNIISKFNKNNDEIINYRYLDHSKIFNNTMLDTTRARNFCAFKWNIKNTK